MDVHRPTAVVRRSSSAYVSGVCVPIDTTWRHRRTSAAALGMTASGPGHLDMESYDTANTACNDAASEYVRATITVDRDVWDGPIAVIGRTGNGKKSRTRRPVGRAELSGPVQGRRAGTS
ncbi:hypothetical protein ABZ153_16730 [Streptomyces sp. NPDC006290]|uniref:hypothetical protein n=1 Tax=Streptomyces sp. NPDC006290 TaxID=3156745 RepID=UPI0033BB960B